jgi:hypothetical protein
MHFSLYLTLIFLLNIFFLHSDTTVEGFTNRHIQKAIDLEYAKGGGVVICPEGEYVLRNAIYLKDNVKIMGKGAKTVLKKCPLFSTRIIHEIHEGDNLVYVKNPSVFKVGDGITIYSQSLIPARVWITEIMEIFPYALRLKDRAPLKVSLSSNPFVFCSFPCIYCKEVNNISIHDLSIDGNSEENPMINTWWDSGLGCNGASKVDIVNVTIHDAAGDGISLNNSHHVSIKDSVINSSARLGIHVGDGSKYTHIANSKIINSGMANIINIDGLYLCFGAAFGLYENNIITNTRGAGLSIGNSDSGNIFLNNKIFHNSIGLLFRVDSFETMNLFFSQNNISNNFDWDIYMQEPVHRIFMDKWPQNSYIHPHASDLFDFQYPQNGWMRFH